MKTTYKTGDNVVYPMHGVGIIVKIEEKKILDKKQLYYILKLSSSDMTAMIPVDKSETLGLRPCAKTSEVEEAFSILNQAPETVEEDWKVRYNNNHSLIKKGNLLELAQVVRNLYHRNKIKELSSTEKKLFEYALQLMIDEISIARKTDKMEIEDNITRILEKSEASN